MRVIDALFAPEPPEGGFAVPLTRYQAFEARRFRMDRSLDLNDEHDRFQALLWYIEGYCVHRKPLRAPFAPEQVRWLLEPDAPWMSRHAVPRVVEAFRRRRLPHHDPYGSEQAHIELAVWWTLEQSIDFGVEHALVPEAFIDRLKAPVPGGAKIVPISEGAAALMKRRTDVAWTTGGVVERLACYIRLLCEPMGRHYALVFPDVVLAALQAFPTVDAVAQAPVDAAAPQAAAVRSAAEAAARYAAAHRLQRSGETRVWASEAGQDWRQAAPPRFGRARGERPTAAEAQEAGPPGPVRVIGPLAAQSGLGQAARQSVRSLLAAGILPEGVEFDLDNPSPSRPVFDLPPVQAADRAINLVHLNAETLPLGPAYLGPETWAGAYTIGYFFWELPRPAKVHTLAVEMVDEIWVASEFNAEGYRAVTDKPVTAVGMAVEPEPAGARGRRAEMRARYGLAETDFVFLTAFDGYSFLRRKNPAGAIRAFLRAFGGTQAGVRLVIKTQNYKAVITDPTPTRAAAEVARLAAADPRILLVDESLPYADLMALTAAADAYVSLHRSEGWGFGAQEALQLGVPVIATDFSGTRDFCTPETAIVVPWSRLYLEPDDYIFVQPGDWWADPDIEAAAAAMRQLYEDQAGAQALGSRGRAHIQARFSPAAVGERYLARLREIGARWA